MNYPRGLNIEGLLIGAVICIVLFKSALKKKEDPSISRTETNIDQERVMWRNKKREGNQIPLHLRA